jgi:hypothetical protein
MGKAGARLIWRIWGEEDLGERRIKDHHGRHFIIKMAILAVLVQ